MTWYLLAGLIGLTVTTFVSRGGFWLLPERLQLPQLAQQALRYAPACALVAIIAPSLFTLDGAPSVSLDDYRIYGVAAAVVVFLRWRNMIAAITIGMVTFTVLRLTIGA